MFITGPYHSDLGAGLPESLYGQISDQAAYKARHHAPDQVLGAMIQNGFENPPIMFDLMGFGRPKHPNPHLYLESDNQQGGKGIGHQGTQHCGGNIDSEEIGEKNGNQRLNPIRGQQSDEYAQGHSPCEWLLFRFPQAFIEKPLAKQLVQKAAMEMVPARIASRQEQAD